MRTGRHIAVYARTSCRDSLGVDAETVWLAKLAEDAAAGVTTESWTDIADDGRGEPGPSLRRLLDRVAAGEIDDVLVGSLAALGVDFARVQRIYRALAEAGVALLTPETLQTALAQPIGAA